MTLLPFERALVLAEEPLTLQELRRVQNSPCDLVCAAAIGGSRRASGGATRRSPARRRDHVMQHLVVHDVRDEIPRHPLAIERRVDADEPLEARVASKLDGLAGPFAASRLLLPPRDQRVAAAPEVALVYLLEEGEEVVVRALREEREGLVGS